MNNFKIKKILGARLTVALVALLAVMLAPAICDTVPDADAETNHPVYGMSTTISIAPGMRYSYNPSWPADLTVTTTIELQKQGSLTGNDVSIGTLSGANLVVRIPTSASAGTQYHLVLKGTATDPPQTDYVYIIFNVVGNLAVSGSQADVWAGTAISMVPTHTGLGTATWAVKSGTSLPPGLSLTPSTGRVSGTVSSPGQHTISLTCTTQYGEQKDLVIPFRVGQHLAVSGSQPNVVQGTPIDIAPSATGSGDKVWSVKSGTTLPQGLALAGGHVTGTIDTAGQYSVKLTCRSTYGTLTDSKDLTITFTIRSLLGNGADPASGAIVYEG